MFPRFVLAHGGQADFVGRPNATYALLSAPFLSVNARFSRVRYLLPRPRLVVGTAPTDLYVVIHDKKMNRIHVAMHSDSLGFRLQKNGKWDGYEYATSWKQYEAHGTRILSKMRSVCVRSRGWEVNATRTLFLAPLDKSPRGWLEVSIRPLDAFPRLARRYGRSTLGHVSPHGLLGQSYDGDGHAVDGALDHFANNISIGIARAQAQGALEGGEKDYEVAHPFATGFAYSRFAARRARAPRDVQGLAGHFRDTRAVDVASVARTHYALAPEDFIRV